MHYTGITYRPPFEANSLLLQVTAGCSHNQCAFCTMYRNVPFRVEPITQIDEDLAEASRYADQIDRVFLENGDAFVLDANRLMEIAGMIHQYLPHAQTIAMYASINNIRTKTDDELKRLRESGINELNIGLESGLDEALQFMNKGYTAEQASRELLRLKNAEIDWGANVIFGAAGPKRRYENAKATAELLNETEPYLIFTGTLHTEPGCPLYEAMQKGDFMESTFGEYLDEEEEFLYRLNLENCLYFGLHPANVVRMQGQLSRDKQKLISGIDEARSILRSRLDKRPIRAGEGAIIG